MIKLEETYQAVHLSYENHKKCKDCDLNVIDFRIGGSVRGGDELRIEPRLHSVTIEDSIN